MASKNIKFPGKLGKPRPHNPYYEKYGVLHRQTNPSRGNELTRDERPPPSPAVKLVTAALVSEIETAIEKESFIDAEMFLLLFNYYNIDAQADNKWAQLSYCLAVDIVPAFRYEKASRGAPKKWNLGMQNQLIYAVANIMKKYPHFSQKDACSLLAKKEAIPVSGKNPEATLYQRYLEAKKALPGYYEDYMEKITNYE